MTKTFLAIAVTGIAVAAVALSLWEVGVGIEEDTIERRLVAAAALDGVVGGRLATTLVSE